MITSTEKLSTLIKSLPTLRIVNREKVELIGSLIVVELMTICVLRVPCLGMYTYHHGVLKAKSIRCSKTCSYLLVEIHLFSCLSMSFDSNAVMDITFTCSAQLNIFNQERIY